MAQRSRELRKRESVGFNHREEKKEQTELKDFENKEDENETSN